MAIHRVRVAWSGSAIVGPGVSTFYAKAMASDAFPTALVTFFDGVRTLFPAGIQWVIPSNGEIINESDGTLAGSWSFPGGGGIATSTGATTYVNGVGARIKWKTNGIHGDRRVVGSTFMVPLHKDVYEGGGNIVAANIATLQAHADALVTNAAGDMVIWSKPAKGGSDGESSVVTAAQAPDLVSWLRSRRT